LQVSNQARDLTVAYKDRIVAFIDILGFSTLVNKSISDSESQMKVSDIVNFVRDIVLEQEKVFKTKADPFYLQVSFISDTIVISVDAPISTGDPQFWNILKFAGGIGLSLLAIGVSCRGSIVTGHIFHHRESNFDAVVGPALVKAHELEKSVAVYPRIVVDSSVYNLWDAYLSAELHQEPWRDVLKQDQDGEWFINIFDHHFIDAVKYLFLYREDFDIIKRAGETIIKELKESKPQTRVRDKYHWLLSQYLPYASTDFINILRQGLF
jgi:hypothetical protein